MSHSPLISDSVLVLSFDSLIATAALSTAVRPRHYAPLAIFFGACDLVASGVAPLVNAALAASSLAPMWDARLLALGYLVPWLLLSGMLVLSGCAGRVRSQNLSAAAYLLPPFFALDNLISPATSPLLAGLGSCAMAAAGFVLGAAVLHRFAPPTARPLWAVGLAVVAIALQLAG
jgi:hypothetical protein